ncbi:MAG: transketolase-like TK C-terminal-containing protein, partial [Bacilli bacterium]
AQKLLAQSNLFFRVVSMPSMSQFLTLDLQAQRQLLPVKSKTITLEALATFGWSAIGDHNFGIDTFGQSAPGPAVMAYFGMTPESIAKKVASIIQVR